MDEPIFPAEIFPESIFVGGFNLGLVDAEFPKIIFPERALVLVGDFSLLLGELQ